MKIIRDRRENEKTKKAKQLLHSYINEDIIDIVAGE